MYYIDDYGFNIKYTMKDDINDYPDKNIFDIFLLTYTDIDKKIISEMEYEIKETIVDFVYNKLCINNPNVFIDTCIKSANKINRDIRFLLIQLLSSKNINISDMYEWDYEKLIIIFYLEIIKDENLKKIFYQYAPKYFSEEESNIVSEYLPKIFGELKNTYSKSEQEELIEKLTSL